jgi:hypothetical protein
MRRGYLFGFSISFLMLPILIFTVVGRLFSFSVVLCISVFIHWVMLVLLLWPRQLSEKTLKYDTLPGEEISNCPCLVCFSVL